MRVHIGLGDALPPCQDISQASWVGCVVVPGVTKGTLTYANQPISVNTFGQEVAYTPQSISAFQANTQAAATAGGPVAAASDPGAVPKTPSTTTVAAQTEAPQSTSTSSLNDYLPYVLIAAAVLVVTRL